LLLAGVTLATGFSWLTLLDGVGQAVVKVRGWIGALVGGSAAPGAARRPAISLAIHTPPDDRMKPSTTGLCYGSGS
jgi:hypothetical protein